MSQFSVVASTIAPGAIEVVELETLDLALLADVNGGFSWADIGRGTLSGLLTGAGQGLQSGGWLKGLMTGGIMGFAQALVSQINQANIPDPGTGTPTTPSEPKVLASTSTATSAPAA